jgi:hypothetical protein
LAVQYNHCIDKEVTVTIARSFVFFWETESGKFIFESARERTGQIGKNLTGEEICRGRLKEGNKKTFDWSNKEVFVIELTEWIDQHPEMFTQAKDPITWAENSILRKVLKAKGYPVLLTEGKEKHQGDMHQAIADLKEYLFGTPTAKDFKPKQRTTARLLSFVNDLYANKHTYNKVLYGATMGAGKTSDFLHSTQASYKHGSNVHLCVTSMPDTRKDLCRDVADGIQFQNIVVVVPDKALPDVQFILKHRAIGFSDLASVGSDPSKNYILSLGVQDARGSDGDKYKHILEQLKFGIYGKDEVHTNQGEFSMFAKNVEPFINFDLAVYMTGTPEKFILEGSEFVEDNTILFLANDLYEAQADGDPDWQGYPLRNFFVLDYKSTQDIVAKHLGLEQAQLWTLEKQWSWDKDNGILMHDAAVRELIKTRFGVGIYKDDPRCFWGPGSRAAKDNKRTIVVGIANGDTAEKTQYVAKLIEEETGSKGFSAHEPNGYDNWLNYCNNNDGSSHFVTHDKDMTGKNNPWINKQWFSLNIGSSTRAGQHAGRGSRKLIVNGVNIKPEVDYFFDNPDTAISVVLDPLEATTADPGSTSKTAEKIHRIASFWFEGTERWKKATIPDIVKFIQEMDPIGVRGLNSLRHINTQAQCPEHLKGSLAAAKTPKSASVDLSDIEGDQGSNAHPEEQTKDFDNKDDSKLYRQNLQKSIRGLAKALIRTEAKYADVRSILANPVIEAEDQFISLEQICKTPLSFADLQAAFDCGNVSETSVNKCLSVIKTKLEESSKSVNDHLNFLNHADLIDDDTKFIPEPVDLVTDYVYNVLSRLPKGISLSIGDLCAGRGAYLIEALQQAPKHNVIIKPSNVYYNDIDPITVSQFRKINKDFKLGIPDVNITCIDAQEYNIMKFDVGIGNPAFNISDKETGNGTGGNVNLYKQISDAYPIKDGGIKSLITPKGIIKHLMKDDEFNVLDINLMTEKHYWKYNTCYWVAKKEANQRNFIISDRVISKVFQLGDNPNWYELNGDVNKKKIDWTGPGAINAIVGLPTKKTAAVYSMVDPSWEKIAFGPKFCATLFENKATYFVTADPLCARFSGAVLTNTIVEAEKIKLFVENSKLLPAINKKLKIKGLFWTMRHLKPFDPNQIVTGYEVPVEWNLTADDLKYLGV